ncbi:hypothetical protein GE061_006000 [Apolygus lucorum]|uniref:DUF4780 domain-containing protein n=1 Tax=Apolygus lucorum TaxID=248454 RepID=A0A6A4J3A4_APOLU|nr:hypothetical protein GE061_006000 [Apolygus lucorum]
MRTRRSAAAAAAAASSADDSKTVEMDSASEDCENNDNVDESAEKLASNVDVGSTKNDKMIPSQELLVSDAGDGATQNADAIPSKVADGGEEKLETNAVATREDAEEVASEEPQKLESKSDGVAAQNDDVIPSQEALISAGDGATQNADEIPSKVGDGGEEKLETNAVATREDAEEVASEEPQKLESKSNGVAAQNDDVIPSQEALISDAGDGATQNADEIPSKVGDGGEEKLETNAVATMEDAKEIQTEAPQKLESKSDGEAAQNDDVIPSQEALVSDAGDGATQNADAVPSEVADGGEEKMETNAVATTEDAEEVQTEAPQKLESKSDGVAAQNDDMIPSQEALVSDAGDGATQNADAVPSEVADGGEEKMETNAVATTEDAEEVQTEAPQKLESKSDGVAAQNDDMIPSQEALVSDAGDGATQNADAIPSKVGDGGEEKLETNAVATMEDAEEIQTEAPQKLESKSDGVAAQNDDMIPSQEALVSDAGDGATQNADEIPSKVGDGGEEKLETNAVATMEDAEEIQTEAPQKLESKSDGEVAQNDDVIPSQEALVSDAGDGAIQNADAIPSEVADGGEEKMETNAVATTEDAEEVQTEAPQKLESKSDGVAAQNDDMIPSQEALVSDAGDGATQNADGGEVTLDQSHAIGTKNDADAALSHKVGGSEENLESELEKLLCDNDDSSRSRSSGTSRTSRSSYSSSTDIDSPIEIADSPIEIICLDSPVEQESMEEEEDGGSSPTPTDAFFSGLDMTLDEKKAFRKDMTEKVNEFKPIGQKFCEARNIKFPKMKEFRSIIFALRKDQKLDLHNLELALIAESEKNPAAILTKSPQTIPLLDGEESKTKGKINNDRTSVTSTGNVDSSKESAASGGQNGGSKKIETLQSGKHEDRLHLKEFKEMGQYFCISKALTFPTKKRFVVILEELYKKGELDEEHVKTALLKDAEDAKKGLVPFTKLGEYCANYITYRTELFEKFEKVGKKFCDAQNIYCSSTMFKFILDDLFKKGKLEEKALESRLIENAKSTLSRSQMVRLSLETVLKDILPPVDARPVTKPFKEMTEKEKNEYTAKLTSLKHELKPVAIEHCHKIKAPFPNREFHQICCILLDFGMTDKENIKVAVGMNFDDSCRNGPPLSNKEVDTIIKHYRADRKVNPSLNRDEVLKRVPGDLLNWKHYWSLLYKEKRTNLFLDREFNVDAKKFQTVKDVKPSELENTSSSRSENGKSKRNRPSKSKRDSRDRNKNFSERQREQVNAMAQPWSQAELNARNPAGDRDLQRLLDEMNQKSQIIRSLGNQTRTYAESGGPRKELLDQVQMFTTNVRRLERTQPLTPWVIPPGQPDQSSQLQHNLLTQQFLGSNLATAPNPFGPSGSGVSSFSSWSDVKTSSFGEHSRNQEEGFGNRFRDSRDSFLKEETHRTSRERQMVNDRSNPSKRSEYGRTSSPRKNDYDRSISPRRSDYDKYIPPKRNENDRFVSQRGDERRSRDFNCKVNEQKRDNGRSDIPPPTIIPTRFDEFSRRDDRDRRFDDNARLKREYPSRPATPPPPPMISTWSEPKQQNVDDWRFPKREPLRKKSRFDVDDQTKSRQPEDQFRKSDFDSWMPSGPDPSQSHPPPPLISAWPEPKSQNDDWKFPKRDPPQKKSRFDVDEQVKSRLPESQFGKSDFDSWLPSGPGPSQRQLSPPLKSAWSEPKSQNVDDWKFPKRDPPQKKSRFDVDEQVKSIQPESQFGKSNFDSWMLPAPGPSQNVDDWKFPKSDPPPKKSRFDVDEQVKSIQPESQFGNSNFDSWMPPAPGLSQLHQFSSPSISAWSEPQSQNVDNWKVPKKDLPRKKSRFDVDEQVKSIQPESQFGNSNFDSWMPPAPGLSQLHQFSSPSIPAWSEPQSQNVDNGKFPKKDLPRKKSRFDVDEQVKSRQPESQFGESNFNSWMHSAPNPSQSQPPPPPSITLPEFDASSFRYSNNPSLSEDVDGWRVDESPPKKKSRFNEDPPPKKSNLNEQMQEFLDWMNTNAKPSGSSESVREVPSRASGLSGVKTNPPLVKEGEICKVAIVHESYPRLLISSNEANLIRDSLLDRIGVQTGVGPRFCDTYEERGAVVFECEDQLTVTWLWVNSSTISPWPGAELKPMAWEKPIIEITLEVPKIMERQTPDSICERLMSQNPGLSTKQWKMKRFDSSPTGNILEQFNRSFSILADTNS